MSDPTPLDTPLPVAASHGRVRFERPVSGAERFAEFVVGWCFAGIPLYLATDDHGVGLPWALLVVLPVAAFGLFMVWAAAAYRGRVITVEDGALEVRKLAAPFARERIQRVPAGEIAEVRVEELYDNDWPPGEEWRWRTTITFSTSRRKLELATWKTDRAAVLANAEQLRRELQLSTPVWAESKWPGPA